MIEMKFEYESGCKITNFEILKLKVENKEYNTKMAYFEAKQFQFT